MRPTSCVAACSVSTASAEDSAAPPPVLSSSGCCAIGGVGSPAEASLLSTVAYAAALLVPLTRVGRRTAETGARAEGGRAGLLKRESRRAVHGVGARREGRAVANAMAAAAAGSAAVAEAEAAISIQIL